MGIFNFRKKESIEYIIQRTNKKIKPDEAEKFALSSDNPASAFYLLLDHNRVEYSNDILDIVRKHLDWMNKRAYSCFLRNLDEDVLCDPKNNDILEKIIVSVDGSFYGGSKLLKNPKLIERLIYPTKGEIIKYTDVKTLENNLYLLDNALDAGLRNLHKNNSFVDKIEFLKSKVIIRRLIEKKATSCLKSISGDFYKSNPDILDEMIKNDIYIEPDDVEIVERYIELGKPNIIDFFYKIDKYPELIKKAIEKGYLNRDSRNRVASVILSSSSLSRQYVESNCEKGYSLIDEICLNLRRKESLGGNEFQTVRFLLKSGHGNLLVRSYSGYKVMFSNETINLLIDGGCPNIINYLKKEKTDEGIINKALEKGFSVDKDISDNVVGYLSLHPELVLNLIKRGNGNAFLCFKDDEQYLTQENLEFALQNGLNDEKVKAYWHNKELADMLKKDQRYVLKFVQNGGVNAINYLNEKSLTEHPELVELCLNNGLEKIDSYPLYKVINSNSEYLKKAVSMGLITSSVVKSNVDYINMYLDYIGKSYISIQNSSSGISKTAFDFFNSIPVSVLKDNPEIIKRFIENIDDKEHLSDYQFNFSPFIINTILNNSELLDYYISVCPAFINEIENPTREQVLSYVRIWRDFGYQANDKVRKKLEEIFNDDFDLLIEYSNYTEGRIVAFAGETLLAAHPELFTGNVARVSYGFFYDAGIIGYAGNGFQKVIGSNVSLIRRYMKSSGGYVINLATEDILKEHPELIEEAFAAGYHTKFANKRSIIDYNPELIKKINLRDIKIGDAVLREYIFESRELLEYFSSEDNNCLLLDCTPRGFFDNPDNKWLLEKAKERSYVITDSTPEYIVDILYENGFDINISEKSSDKLKNLFWEKAKEKPSLISNLSYPLMLENLDLILNILNELSDYDKLQIIFGGNEYQNFQISPGISEVVNDERILGILISDSSYFSKLAVAVFINFEKLKNNEELMSKFILIKLKSYTPIDFEVENYIDTKFQLVYKFIDEGYCIMDSSPSVFKQFKYIKYAVEKGQKSAIDYLDISSINDNEKQELDKLVFKLIDNGYKISNNSPNYLKQFKYIRYLVEKGQVFALDYLDFSSLNQDVSAELFFNNNPSYKSYVVFINKYGRILKEKGILKSSDEINAYFDASGPTEKLKLFFRNNPDCTANFLSDLAHNDQVLNNLSMEFINIFEYYLLDKYFNNSKEKYDYLFSKIGPKLLFEFDNNILKFINYNIEDIQKFFRLFEFEKGIIPEQETYNNFIISLCNMSFKKNHSYITNIFTNVKVLIRELKDVDGFINGTTDGGLNDSLYNELTSAINDIVTTLNIDKSIMYYAIKECKNLNEDPLHDICRRYLEECQRRYLKENGNKILSTVGISPVIDKEDATKKLCVHLLDTMSYENFVSAVETIKIKINYENIKNGFIDEIKMTKEQFDALISISREQYLLIVDAIRNKHKPEHSVQKQFALVKNFMMQYSKISIDNNSIETSELDTLNINKKYQIELVDVNFIKILSELDFDVLFNSDEDVLNSLTRTIRSYRLGALPESLTSGFENNYKISLPSGINNIGLFITRYMQLLKNKKERLRNIGDDTELKNITFSFEEIVKLISSVNSETYELKRLICSSEYLDFINNSSPNSSSYSRKQREEKMALIVDYLYSLGTITIPSHDMILEGDDGKDINIIVGNRTNSANICHGERTGACMRVGGVGESLFLKCITDKNWFHIRLENPITHEYISRVSGFRNGNTVYLNQLRNVPAGSKYTNEDLQKFIKKYAEMLIEETKDSEFPIENVFINTGYAMSSVGGTIYHFGEIIQSDYNLLGVEHLGLRSSSIYTDVRNNALLLATTEEGAKTQEGYMPLKNGPENTEVYDCVRDKIYGLNGIDDDRSKHIFVTIGLKSLIEKINRVHAMKEKLIGKDYQYEIIDIILEEPEIIDGYVSSDWYVYVDSNYKIHSDYISRINNNGEMLPYSQSEKAKEEMEYYQNIISNKYSLYGEVRHAV